MNTNESTKLQDLEALKQQLSELNDKDLTSLFYSLLYDNRIFFPYAYSKERLEEAVERGISEDDFQKLCEDDDNHSYHMIFVNEFLDQLEREFEDENEEEVDENE